MYYSGIGYTIIIIGRIVMFTLSLWQAVCYLKSNYDISSFKSETMLKNADALDLYIMNECEISIMSGRNILISNLFDKKKRHF